MSYSCIMFSKIECDGCGRCDEVDSRKESNEEKREIEDDKRVDEEREEGMIRRYHNE